MTKAALFATVFCCASLALAATTPEDLVKEAQTLETDGKVQQAVKLYESFLKQYPDHTQVPDVNYRLAKCYDALGYPKETAEALRKALSVDKSRFKQRTEAQYMLAKLHGSMKEYKKALEVYEKMLGEGAGLYEDEVLNTAALYYALQGEYDAAAAKYNILRRRDDAKLARAASAKLAALWIKAEKADMAVGALRDFATQYPDDEAIPDLLLRTAALFVKQQKADKAIAVCEQLKRDFAKAPEAAGAGYIVGTIYRERKQYKEAADAFDQTVKVAASKAKHIAAEAAAQAAEVYFNDLRDTKAAMQRYTDAAGYARQADSERAVEILKHCYFRLAEDHFAKKEWNAAYDLYAKLRDLGVSDINILPRITKCQAELGIADQHKTPTYDEKMLKEVIASQPRTLAAAEAQITLLNQKVAEAIRRKASTTALAEDFERMLTAYPKDVLADNHLAAYICMRAGEVYAEGQGREDLVKSIAAYEKVLKVDPAKDNPYTINAMENIATLARQTGDAKRARDMEERLFKLKMAELEEKKGDAEVEKKALDYMKTLFSHASTPQLADQSIEAARKLIAERGPLSDLSREARFYIGELCYMKKDFSRAAKEFQEYVKIYGPAQKPDGELKDGPWKPGRDAKAEQVFEAAIRVAHSWYMQGHEQNMVKQYQWIVRNMPDANRWLPEAAYWVAMEYAKGEAGKTAANKKKLADALWTGVVHPSTDFDDPKFATRFYSWVKSDDPHIQGYVRSAVLKAGQAWSDAEDYESAAGAFKTYLALFKEKPRKGGGKGKAPVKVEPSETDEMYQTARYALGLQYLALKNYPKLIETYKPYLNEARQESFRVNALQLLGYYAGQAKIWDVAQEAYATLLDEYGPNKLDSSGKPTPLPSHERLRPQAAGWNGIRMEPPKGLDLGQVRFALGFWYWEQEQFAKCAQTLALFLTDAALRSNGQRDQALFMTGRSYYRLRDYAAGLPPLLALVKDYPRFGGVQQAYVLAAQGCVETKNWTELELLWRNFNTAWSKSDRRSRMELYRAVGLVGSAKASEGMAALASVARSDTYEDVRAEAYYHLARATQAAAPDNPAKTTEAFDHIKKSVSLAARDNSCLAAGEIAMKLKLWDEARGYLERVGRDFPQAAPENVKKARELHTEVLKQLAAKGKK